jgi:hypothetical protein
LRGRCPGEVDVFLDGERDAVERRELAAGDGDPVGLAGGLEHLLVKADHDRVDGGVHGLYPAQVRFDDLADRHLPAPDQGGELGRAQPPRVDPAASAVGGHDESPPRGLAASVMTAAVSRTSRS